MNAIFTDFEIRILRYICVVYRDIVVNAPEELFERIEKVKTMLERPGGKVLKWVEIGELESIWRITQHSRSFCGQARALSPQTLSDNTVAPNTSNDISLYLHGSRHRLCSMDNI